MTAKEIDEKARHDEDITNCTLTEAGLFYKLQLLYSWYKSELMSVDSAKEEKARLFEAFEIEAEKDKQIAEHEAHVYRLLKAMRDDDTRRVIISPLISQANKNGCPLCREIARIYDGRIQG